MNKMVKFLKWWLFSLWIAARVKKIRKKEKIRFLFILSELTQWKTELLYQKMLSHPRFEPILGITPSRGYKGAERNVIDYCKQKGYSYILLNPTETILSQVNVDFVMHQKPYNREIHPAHYIDNNKRVPVILIPYFLSTITEDWVVNQRVSFFAWRQFVDNESCRKAWSKIHKFKGLNYRVTGTPIMDELLTPKEQLKDVWPINDGRKRIIYAPHHTISDFHWEGIAYSTFLEYCQFMLEMRDKYKDKVYFVFKPHPSLKDRLDKIWGKEKTDSYYLAWEQTRYSHVASGKYLELFKYSDALIHDCGSYTVEYMYTANPIMYLIRDEHHSENMIPYARKAFDLHYKGFNQADIEQFIQDVINGNDPLKSDRVAYRASFLMPPHGKSACENIIDSILGQ